MIESLIPGDITVSGFYRTKRCSQRQFSSSLLKLKSEYKIVVFSFPLLLSEQHGTNFAELDFFVAPIHFAFLGGYL